MAKTTMAVMVLQRNFRKRLEVKPRLNRKNLVDRVKLESVLKVALLEIGLLFLLMATLYLQKAAEVDLGSLNDLRTTFVNHFGLHDLKDKTALVSDAKNFVTSARHQPSVFSGRNLFDPCQSDRRLGFRTRVCACVCACRSRGKLSSFNRPLRSTSSILRIRSCFVASHPLWGRRD
jgi:energy-converting hydrogenase Eha subunit C